MAEAVTMDFEQARFNMVEQQIRPWDVLDPGVLHLMSTVKREDFVPTAYRALAFADAEIPLSADASMWPPRVEARLLQELAVKNGDRVLEIGTGSGFFAALLAAVAAEVFSYEIDPQLAETARANLARGGVDNVTVFTGDGLAGAADRAPFDVIVVGGGVPAVPDALLRQLKIGGRLVAIVGEEPAMEAQLITQTADGVFATVNLFETTAAYLRNVRPPSSFNF